MATSDPEYSDDDVVISGTAGRRLTSRPKQREAARWEQGAGRSYELHEGADGSIAGVLGGIEEAGKRRRYAELKRAEV